MCEHRKGPHGAASKHASDNMPLQTRGARSVRGVRNEGCGCGCRMCRAQQTSICPVADRDTLKQAQSTPSTAPALPTAHSSQAGRRWPGQRRRRQAPTHGPQTSRACGLVLQSYCSRGAADNVTVNKGGRAASAGKRGGREPGPQLPSRRHWLLAQRRQRRRGPRRCWRPSAPLKR